MGFRRGPEYLALPTEENPWLVKGVVPRGGSVNLFGKPKLGKSFAALQLASLLSNPESTDWLGFPILEHGPVAYLQVDTPRGLWKARVEELQLLGFSFKEVYFADGMDAPYPFNIMADGFPWMQDALEHMGNEAGEHVTPLLVVVDTLRDVHAGAEDDSAHVKNVVTQIRAAVGWASAILIVSHARKGGTAGGFPGYQPDIRDENRGSGALAGTVDTIVWQQEKQIQVIGRGIEHAVIGVKQDPDTKLIELADPFLQDGLRLLALHPGLPERELARRLQGLHTKKSLEACRSAIRRMAASGRNA